MARQTERHREQVTRSGGCSFGEGMADGVGRDGTNRALALPGIASAAAAQDARGSRATCAARSGALSDPRPDAGCHEIGYGVRLEPATTPRQMADGHRLIEARHSTAQELVVGLDRRPILRGRVAPSAGGPPPSARRPLPGAGNRAGPPPRESDRACAASDSSAPGLLVILASRAWLALRSVSAAALTACSSAEPFTATCSACSCPSIGMEAVERDVELRKLVQRGRARLVGLLHVLLARMRGRIVDDRESLRGGVAAYLECRGVVARRQQRARRRPLQERQRRAPAHRTVGAQIPVDAVAVPPGPAPRAPSCRPSPARGPPDLAPSCLHAAPSSCAPPCRRSP